MLVCALGGAFRAGPGDTHPTMIALNTTRNPVIHEYIRTCLDIGFFALPSLIIAELHTLRRAVPMRVTSHMLQRIRTSPVMQTRAQTIHASKEGVSCCSLVRVFSMYIWRSGPSRVFDEATWDVEMVVGGKLAG